MSGCWVCVCGLTLEEGGVVRVGMGWDIVVKDLGVCLYGRVFFELFCEGWGAGERERKGQMGFGFVRWWERMVGHTYILGRFHKRGGERNGQVGFWFVG